MLEREVMQKCLTVFENLGWSVGQEEKVEGCPYRFDMVLRHNEKIYGFVEVVAKETLKQNLTDAFPNKRMMIEQVFSRY